MTSTQFCCLKPPEGWLWKTTLLYCNGTKYYINFTLSTLSIICVILRWYPVEILWTIKCHVVSIICKVWIILDWVSVADIIPTIQVIIIIVSISPFIFIIVSVWTLVGRPIWRTIISTSIWKGLTSHL